jgi:phytoene desaturase
MRVVVVGAGLGGLSAAAHLAGRGHDVTVLERSALPGGRAGLVANDLGYRLDDGPAVLTMPELLEQAFAALGSAMADFVTVVPVDPMYRAVYADGAVLHVRHGREAMALEIERFASARDAAGFLRFCDWLERLYRAEMPHYIDANLDGALDLVKPWRAALTLTRLGAFGRLAPRVARYFADERLRRIFSFQAMYAGLAPHQALALYGVITYMDSVAGVYAPFGGMHAMAAGLAGALEKSGVTLRYDAEVTAIERWSSTGAVRGVTLRDGERLDADAVVCNADLPVAYETLLPDVRAPRAARRGTYSPSCLLWVAGVRGTAPAGAARHNIHFGHEWDGAFRALLDDGTPMPDPSILVTMHSVGDPSLAPSGCSTLYALEPMPNLGGRVDWARERGRLTASLRQRVAALGYPGDVEVEAVIDPRDWERRGMARGTPFALAHTFRQTGPFRPGNVDDRVPGLVFVGSGTVPGVGVPMVLVSGRLAAERVDELARRRP